MELRPLDVILLHSEAEQLSVCCDCYLRECDTCPANATKEKLKEIVKVIRESKKMENLIKMLNEFFGSDEKLNYEEDVVPDIVEHIEDECFNLLINGNGECNWNNIKALRDKGFSVYRGDGDSFGWLTGCISKPGDSRVICYGW